MGDAFTRTVQLERGIVDMETGRFPMVLATEGEASDGHILSVSGIETQERMPMLFAHDDWVPPLGSVVEPVKGRKNGLPVLRATGQFNLNGEGPLSDTRRDLAQLVHDGDLASVSIRWDPIEAVPRTSLPKDHKFYQSDGFGRYYKKSRALEGSLVSIGADPKAIVGRAQATESDASRVFLTALARSIEQNEEGMGELAAGFEALSQAIGDLRKLGVEDVDLYNAVRIDAPEEDFIRYGEVLVPRPVWDDLMGESVALYREAVKLALERPPENVYRIEVKTDDAEDEPETAQRSGSETSAPVGEPEKGARENEGLDAGKVLAAVTRKLPSGNAEVIRGLTGRSTT